MGHLEVAGVHAFLKELGRRHRQASTLFLLGGSALCLLGSSRPTVDIDYVGHDLEKDELQHTIEQVAKDMKIEVEVVPISEFVPLPEGAHERNIEVGQFGTIKVFIFDPYTIALSKVDRGLDIDIEEILFLIQQNLITFEHLETIVQTALNHAPEFGLDPSGVREHVEVVRSQL